MDVVNTNPFAGPLSDRELEAFLRDFEKNLIKRAPEVSPTPPDKKPGARQEHPIPGRPGERMLIVTFYQGSGIVWYNVLIFKVYSTNQAELRGFLFNHYAGGQVSSRINRSRGTLEVYADQQRSVIKSSRRSEIVSVDLW